MSSVLRIIDANANRAREALRVMEEAARFHLDDRELTEGLKSLRHDFARAMSRLDGIEFHRDTAGDVGTTITTESEQRRASIADVAIASGKRLSEALRAIEEYGKTIDPEFAALVQSLRYRGYELERRLHLRLAASHPRQWTLCLLLTESLCARPWRDVLGAALDGGVDCVQVREKTLDDRVLLARTVEIVSVCGKRGAAVIVNDRPDVALLAGADGVHLGQTDLPSARVRELAGRRLVIGVSTSTLDEAKRALDEGADYCGVGPMFPTATKKKDRIAGPAYLREFIDWGRLPHLAIGGIDASNVDELVSVGCRGVAVSAAVCGASDPAAATRALCDVLSAAPVPR